jgi:hypothetical protein
MNVGDASLLSHHGSSFGLAAHARSDSLLRMIELEVYACGLRDGDNVLQLQSQMDVMPRIRYKVDVRHDLVYFEIDNPAEVTQRSITKMFEAIGLEARFVGQIPPEIELGSDTIRLV